MQGEMQEKLQTVNFNEQSKSCFQAHSNRQHAQRQCDETENSSKKKRDEARDKVILFTHLKLFTPTWTHTISKAYTAYETAYYETEHLWMKSNTKGQVPRFSIIAL